MHQPLGGLGVEPYIVDDQREQSRPVGGGAKVDVAQDTCAAFLIVGRDAVLVAELADRPHQLTEGVGLEGAVKAGNHLVGLGGVEASLHPTFALTDGVHPLVAVALGDMLAVPLHGQNGTDAHVRKPRLSEGLLHAGMLGDQLVLVLEVAVHATAAGLGSRTKLLLRPHGGGGHDLHQLAHAEGLGALDDLRPHHVPRDGALDEHHKTPVGSPLGHSGHAATEVVQVMDADRHHLGLFVSVGFLLRHRTPYRPPDAGIPVCRRGPDRSR